MSYDLVIRGGTVATAEKTFRADVGIYGERIAEVGANLTGKSTIDATGQLVLPGGIDSHCHIEQLSVDGHDGGGRFLLPQRFRRHSAAPRR